MEIDSKYITLKLSADDFIQHMSEKQFEIIKKSFIESFESKTGIKIKDLEYSYDEDGYSYLGGDIEE